MGLPLIPPVGRLLDRMEVGGFIEVLQAMIPSKLCFIALFTIVSRFLNDSSGEILSKHGGEGSLFN